MNHRIPGILAAALSLAVVNTYAQRGPQPPPPTPKAAAPVDFTGYWLSVVTEDWRFRMLTPRKGDYESLPLNPEGRKVADTWDPAKDQADGDRCKAYGAAAVLRMPGRLRITWENESTLRLDTDAGTQTRMFHFGGQAPQGGEPQLQGYSIANWEASAATTGVAARPDNTGRPRLAGSLKVVTTHLRPGYLRKNGVPYSGNALLTEYVSRADEDDGDSWLVVTAIVEDPQYLTQPFITSTHFRKQADASGWNPRPCVDR
jgi:hypothetical protein